MEIITLDKKSSHPIPDLLQNLKTKGTYALILYNSQTADITIGKLGKFNFAAGYYAYVGSAFGPGGLTARIRHHLKIAVRPHWHIDYLRAETQIIEIWYVINKVEHIWADWLNRLTGAQIPVKGFGCSDCRCLTHLFYYPDKPSFLDFRKIV